MPAFQSTTFMAALAAILVFAWFCRSGATTPIHRSARLAELRVVSTPD